MLEKMQELLKLQTFQNMNLKDLMLENFQIIYWLEKYQSQEELGGVRSAAREILRRRRVCAVPRQGPVRRPRWEEGAGAHFHVARQGQGRVRAGDRVPRRPPCDRRRRRVLGRHGVGVGLVGLKSSTGTGSRYSGGWRPPTDLLYTVPSSQSSTSRIVAYVSQFVFWPCEL